MQIRQVSKAVKVMLIIIFMGIVIIIPLILVTGLVMSYYSIPTQKVYENVQYAPVGELGICNDSQYKANAYLFSYNGELWFYTWPYEDINKYTFYLCSISDEGIQKHIKLNGPYHAAASIIGCNQDMIYYWNAINDNTNRSICAYSLKDGSETVLYSGEMLRYDIHYQQGKSLVVPYSLPHTGVNHSSLQQFLICGLQIESAAYTPEVHTCGDYTYSLSILEHGGSEHGCEIIKTNPEGEDERLDLGSGEQIYLYDTKDGLIVHNIGYQNLVYYIDEFGNCENLFSAECLSSQSALTIMNDNVYLSLLRYKEFGEIGMRRFENDDVEGTYRISLDDFSVTKLSDDIYSGFYVFDDCYLYGVNRKGEIVLLDEDAQIIQKLISTTD